MAEVKEDKCNYCNVIETDPENTPVLIECFKCEEPVCIDCCCYPDEYNTEYYICPCCEEKRLVEALKTFYKIFPNLTRTQITGELNGTSKKN